MAGLQTAVTKGHCHSDLDYIWWLTSAQPPSKLIKISPRQNLGQSSASVATLGCALLWLSPSNGWVLEETKTSPNCCSIKFPQHSFWIPLASDHIPKSESPSRGDCKQWSGKGHGEGRPGTRSTLTVTPSSQERLVASCLLFWLGFSFVCLCCVLFSLPIPFNLSN